MWVDVGLRWRWRSGVAICGSGDGGDDGGGSSSGGSGCHTDKLHMIGIGW
jgi:hypothetical protein